jgi:hypothetical protein
MRPLYPNEIRNLKIKLSAIKQLAEKRPPGYYEEVVSRGKVEGEFLWIHSRDYQELRLKYNPNILAPLNSGSGPVVMTAPTKDNPYFSVKPNVGGCRSCGR